MLTELHVENFKAWRDLKIELGKVTGLFGQNSSGKSSLLHFLLMLKQTKNAADRALVLDFGGGPTELVNDDLDVAVQCNRQHHVRFGARRRRPRAAPTQRLGRYRELAGRLLWR